LGEQVVDGLPPVVAHGAVGGHPGCRREEEVGGRTPQRGLALRLLVEDRRHVRIRPAEALGLLAKDLFGRDLLLVGADAPEVLADGCLGTREDLLPQQVLLLGPLVQVRRVGRRDRRRPGDPRAEDRNQDDQAADRETEPRRPLFGGGGQRPPLRRSRRTSCRRDRSGSVRLQWATASSASTASSRAGRGTPYGSSAASWACSPSGSTGSSFRRERPGASTTSWNRARRRSRSSSTAAGTGPSTATRCPSGAGRSSASTPSAAGCRSPAPRGSPSSRSAHAAGATSRTGRSEDGGSATSGRRGGRAPRQTHAPLYTGA